MLDQLETVEQSQNALFPGSTSQTLLTLNTASSLWLLVEGVERVLLKLAYRGWESIWEEEDWEVGDGEE